jgi:hypothetical protein
LFSELPFPVADAAIVNWSFDSFSLSDGRAFVDGTLADCDVVPVGDCVTCVRHKVGGGGGGSKGKSVVVAGLGPGIG